MPKLFDTYRQYEGNVSLATQTVNAIWKTVYNVWKVVSTIVQDCQQMSKAIPKVPKCPAAYVVL